MEEILTAYYADNAKKLHKIVDQLLVKFGGLSDKDKDDFYSLANEVFVDVMRRYDHTQPFEAFLYACLGNRIKTEMTRRNRKRRGADSMTVSIDTPINEEGTVTLGDVIADDVTIEREVFEKNEQGYSRRVRAYLSRLSKLQKDILRLHIDGFLPNEIKEELHIDEKQYADSYAAIHSYRNVSVLL